MALNKREVKDIAIIDVQSEIDFNDSTNLKGMVDMFIRDKKYKVLVNLENAPLITSRGMGTFITSQVKLKKYGGNLKICCVSAQNKEIFEMTKLNTVFNIFDTEENAILKYND